MAAKKWKFRKALKKGLVAAGAIGVGMAAGVGMLGDLKDPHQVTAIAGVGALCAAIRIGLNWWKVNKGLADKKYDR